MVLKILKDLISVREGIGGRDKGGGDGVGKQCSSDGVWEGTARVQGGVREAM